jgi:hypothetical protein
MIRSIGKITLFMLLGLGVYAIFTFVQGRAVANLCDNYPSGSRIENIEELEGTFFLTRMGPLPDPEKPGVETLIFCASLTMCDTSCNLEIEKGRVTQARHSAL